MNYHWIDCPNCSCHLAVNWTVRPGETSGSVKRWSADRSINDGKPFVFRGAPAAEAIVVPCVCGAPITLPAEPDAVGGERSEGLRVTLGENSRP
jgi:hypothetical protein